MAITPAKPNSSEVQAANLEAVKSSDKIGEIKAQATPPPKKVDTAIISERAKDLAALKSGTQFKEEANESITVKNTETVKESTAL